MAFHLIGGLRTLARSFLQNQVLQTALAGYHTFFLGIGCQIFLAFFLGNLAFRFFFAVQFLFLLLEIGLYNGLRLTVSYLRILSFQHVLDSCCEVVHIELVDAHLQQLLTDAET